MMLTSQGVVRFFQFLQQIESKAYPESPMEIHTEITQAAFERLSTFVNIRAGMSA